MGSKLKKWRTGIDSVGMWVSTTAPHVSHHLYKQLIISRNNFSVGIYPCPPRLLGRKSEVKDEWVSTPAPTHVSRARMRERRTQTFLERGGNGRLENRSRQSNVMQCVAVCSSVMQCVAVCSSVMQCVTVCCRRKRSRQSNEGHRKILCKRWLKERAWAH